MALLKGILIVANTGSDSLTLIDLKTHYIINTIYLDTVNNAKKLDKSNSDVPCVGPHQVIYGGSKTLYSVNSYNNSVYKINMFNNKIEDVVLVGSFPSHMQLYNGCIYVTNSDSNSISIIDESEFRIIETIPVGERPHDIKIDSAKNVIYVANNNGYSISVIDLKQSKEKKINLKYNPLHILLSNEILVILCQPSNGNLCSNILFLNIASNEVIRNIELPGFTFDMTVSKEEDIIYVTNAEDGCIYKVNIFWGKIISKQYIGGMPNNIIINSTEAYISDVLENKLTVFDIKQDKIVDEIYVGLEPNSLTTI